MGYTGPFDDDPGDGDAHIVIYNYIPSLALGALGTALFVIVASAHTFWFFKSKLTRTFEGLIVLGCIIEVIGYIFRIESHGDPFKVSYFVVQYFFIVVVSPTSFLLSWYSYRVCDRRSSRAHPIHCHRFLAPVTFSASLYLSLGQAGRVSSEIASVLPVSTRTFVSAFIALDIITTLLQIAGAALIGVSESDLYKGKTSPVQPESANHILLAGLAVQVASFTLFLGLLTWTIIRSTRLKPAIGDGNARNYTSSFFVLLFLTSGSVYLRTIFRLAETAQGLFSYASSHEALFGVFEFAPVWIATAIWAVRPLALELKRMSPESTGVSTTHRAVQKV